jgi:iron complex transport system ATP-binding protein
MTDAISVSGLTVSRSGQKLLNLARLQLRAGELLAVVGPNGAGKSTLLRALTGEWASHGQLTLLGRPLRAWSRPLLAQRMAVMPQNSHLQFDFLVHEVVALGRLPHRAREPGTNHHAVQEVIGVLGLESLKHRRFTTLSGGERQRVQFGRVLAQIWGVEQPGLLLLDEPTSALDLAQQKQVLDMARAQSQQGCAVLAVLHDLNLAARYADRIVVLKDGTLKHEGTPDAVLTDGILRSCFGVTATVERAMADDRPMVVLSRGKDKMPLQVGEAHSQ